MRYYRANSPQAQARVLVMTMITDTRIDGPEIEALDALNVYPLLGISRPAFAQVLQDYCADLREVSAPGGRILLLDRDRIDAVIDAVDQPAKQHVVAGLMLALAKADGRVCDGESVVLRYVLEPWGLPVDDLSRPRSDPLHDRLACERRSNDRGAASRALRRRPLRGRPPLEAVA